MITYTGDGPLKEVLVSGVEYTEEQSINYTCPPLTVELDADETLVPAASFVFVMHPKDTDDIDSDAADNYKINGTITVEGSTDKVYLSAYVPSTSTTTTETETEEEDVTKKTTITETQLKWNSVALYSTKERTE